MEPVQISLKDGRFALIDKADAAFIGQYKWTATNGSRPYAQASIKAKGKWTNRLMHRVLLDAPPGKHVDHINGNTLDNRRSNLRLATPQQNAQNRTRPNSGRFIGVTEALGGKWKALIFPASGSIYLGTYSTEEEAAAAYNAAARRIAGEFAGVNDVADIPGILDRLIDEKQHAIARLHAEISALGGKK